MFILKKQPSKKDHYSVVKDVAIMLGYFGGLRLLYIASTKFLQN